MDDGYSINVVVGGEELIFEAKLVDTGYTHRFLVIINGIEVAYEPDEERNYRAIVSTDVSTQITDKDKELIKAVGAQFDALNE